MNIRLNSIKIIIISILSIIILTWKVSAFNETISINGLSWDYSTGDELSKAINSAQWNDSSLNSYLENIQTYTQNREDLQLYFLWKDWELRNYTIMDRNMWADEIYNQKFSNANPQSFWYHYQWWNNYWFEPCNELWCTNFPWWENISENWLYYRVRSVFKKWNFANNTWNQGFRLPRDPDECGCYCGLHWFQYEPWSEAVRTQLFENFRWWFWDSLTINWNSTLNRRGTETSRSCDSNTWNVIKNSWTSSRQWPCPNGYHIPSLAERNDIVETWKNARNWAPLSDNSLDKTEAFLNASYWAQLASDLLLPPAWIRSTYSGEHIYQWVIGGYRSSSPTYFGSNLWTTTDYTNGSRLLVFDQYHLKADGGDGDSVCWYYDEVGHTTRWCYYAWSRFDGESVRCIKNSNNISTKIYPNWWTNAIIAIDWRTITTLSTPSRNWCTFGWRYTDPDFSEHNLITQWSEIYNDAILYAKWIWENCWQTNIKQQNCTSLPENAQWINSKFTQTWDGISWTPSFLSNNYTSDINVECSFQCNTNYTRDSNSGQCVTNVQKADCSWLPNNAQWKNSKFTQIWDWVSRNPSSHENHYTSDSNVECSFQCNTNYSRNSSSKSCEYNWSSWWWGWWGWGSWGWSSSKNSYISISTNRKSPSTDQYINLTIETDNDYTGKINFSKFQYKSSSSSSWSNISRTSSTYVSNYSSAWSNGYYKMTSSDYGYVTLKEIIKFKKSWYYRICVEDTNSNDACIQINVDTSSSSNNYNLSVSASPSNPDTYDWVKLTISTDYDYTDKINFSKFQYKSSSSSSWSTISSRTSSTYVSDYSSDWSNGYYKMTSSDYGYAILKNLIKFKKSGYYRIYIKDTDWNESYVQINVDTSSSSSSSNDDLEVKASPSSPDTYDWIKLTIRTDDDYTGKISFSKFQYKSSSSSSWSTISSRTSSTYVSDYSSDWSNGYYKMTSSDDGEVTLKNLVKFKKSGYYRIYVEDTDGNDAYVQINVDSSSSSSSSSSSESNDWNEFIDLINDLINWKTNQSTNNNSNDQNNNQNNNQSNSQNNNQNNIEPSQYSNNTYTIPNEIYVSRSCKPYNIQYVESLNAYTSPDLNKSEYFVNVEYFKRYVDSKNAQNAECFIWWWRINSSYVDTYTWNDHVTAPNGKIYFISENNWTFSSNQLNAAKSFSTINEIKTYIKNRNPLSKIN